MMNKFFQKLQECFPDKNIQFTLDALNASVDAHGIYAGCRDADDGRSGGVDECAYTWLTGDAMGGDAPCAWRSQDGSSGSSMLDRRFGISVIPVFG